MYYHISPIENKTDILAEGLRATKSDHVYLALTYFDCFMLAPITFRYLSIYQNQKRIYESQIGIFYNWIPKEYNASLFEIDGEGIETYAIHNLSPAKKRFNLFGIDKDSTDQCLIEYLAKEDIPADKIKHVKDFSMSLLINTPKTEEEHDKTLAEIMLNIQAYKCNYDKSIEIYKKQHFEPYPEIYVPEETPHILRDNSKY